MNNRIIVLFVSLIYKISLKQTLELVLLLTGDELFLPLLLILVSLKLGTRAFCWGLCWLLLGFVAGSISSLTLLGLAMAVEVGAIWLARKLFPARLCCCSWSFRLIAYEARRENRWDGRRSNWTERRGVVSRVMFAVWYSVRSGPRKREPRRMKPLNKPPFPPPSPLPADCSSISCRGLVRRRKNAWYSTAHFHRCLQAFSSIRLNMNVCSCLKPWLSSSATRIVNFFFENVTLNW